MGDLATKWKNSRPIKKPDESFRQMHEAHARPLPEKSWRRVSAVGWGVVYSDAALAFGRLPEAARGLLVLGEAEGLSIQQIDQDSQAASFDQTNAYHKFCVAKSSWICSTRRPSACITIRSSTRITRMQNPKEFLRISRRRQAKRTTRNSNASRQEHNILLPDDAWDQNYKGGRRPAARYGHIRGLGGFRHPGRRFHLLF